MIIAICQARMGSTRMPGKVLRPILGRPLIAYLIERLKICQKIDKIIVATSDHRENDLLCECINNLGVEIFRGSEKDVLDRFYFAVKPYEPEAILRITGDCPLIDPWLCDLMISQFVRETWDIIHTGPSFAEGLDCEVFSKQALEKAWQQAQLNSEREHVTQYIYNHPELFKKKTLENDINDRQFRFTVDQDDDFLVVEAIFKALYKKQQPIFSTAEIKNFLLSHPEIYHQNAHIVRNEGLIQSKANDHLIIKQNDV